MRLTQICIERPVTTFMFFLAVLLLGLISLKELSVDLLPDLSYPRFSIITQYAGASPGEIESTITLPLEAAVSTVPGLHRLESSRSVERFSTGICPGISIHRHFNFF